MAHNIFGSRFYSYREPAWHGLGYVSDIPTKATPVLEKLGEYQIGQRPVQVIMADGTVLNTDYKAIVRYPTPDDNEHRVFGVVRDYTLITPRDVTELWDRMVGVPVETLGFLDNGRVLFLSIKLAPFDVGKGDQVDMYQIVISPMDGLNAAEVRRAPVRVVCQNTEKLSAQLAVERFTVRHTASILDDLGGFMRGMYEQAEFKAQVIAEAFKVLAESRITDDEAQELTNQLHRIPTKPVAHPEIPAEMYAKRLDVWNVTKERMKIRQDATMELWKGRVAGGDLPGMLYADGVGTLWRWYNSATELENYRRYRGVESRANSIMFGERGDNMEKAFELAQEFLGIS